MSNNNESAQSSDTKVKSKYMKQPKMKPLDPASYTVTVGQNTLSPIRSGMCLLDSIEGPNDFMTRVKFTFSKQLQ